MNEFCYTTIALKFNKFWTIEFIKQRLHKKWSFPLTISSINVTKSAVSCGFGHIHWRNPQWNTSCFVQWKISSTFAWHMFCPDSSNLEDRRNIRKLYMTARGLYILYMVFQMNVLNDIFYERKMFQPKYHWIEIKYLGAIQNRRGQFFCLRDNAFPQYTQTFPSAIVACRHELERLYIYLIYIQISL